MLDIPILSPYHQPMAEIHFPISLLKSLKINRIPKAYGGTS